MKTKTTPLCDDAAICLERLKSLNADNQRDVRVNLGVLKAARSEILSHVGLNGKGVMTDMVLNALNSAINVGLLLMPQNNTLTPVSFDELNAAVAEVTGGNPHIWDARIYKGHQEVPFINYNSLSRIVEKFRITSQTAQERDQVRREHAVWSEKTFGNVGPVGPLKHLSKEALEAAADPSDPLEWADMQFLLWDAQRRTGLSDDVITKAMIEKLAINKTRQWPEPKDGEPRLHIKEQPAAVSQSPILHSFYIAYHEWLKSGADAASCIFDRRSGLCDNAYDYFIYIGADVSGPLYKMHDAFEAAGLNRELPFNKNVESYDRENRRGECHVNPARVAWVKHHATCLPSPEQYVPQLTTAAADVLSERLRQWSVKGFSTEQDDTYTDCELAAAAISYIEPMEAEHYWPADWHDGSFRPSDYRHNLVKATALLLAEIERIDRAAVIGKEV